MYDFYVTKYKGKMSQDAFETVEVKASAFVSRMLLGQLNGTDDEKLATCAVADVFNACEGRLMGSGAVSENNDGYSVSYGSGAVAEVDVYRRAVAAANLYLTRYRGVGVIG